MEFCCFSTARRLPPAACRLRILFLLSHIRRFDWLLLGAVLLLISIGLLSLFSLSGVSAFPFFRRQIVWAGIGLVGLAASSFIDFRIFRTQGTAVLLFYAFTVTLLLAVLLVSLQIRGVEAWLRVGGVQIQPVEFAKIALVVLLAKFFSRRHAEIYRIRHLAVSGIYTGVPAGLVLLQPDVGSAAVLVAIWAAVVCFSGIRLRHVVLLLVLASLVGWIGWSFGLHEYQKERVVSFFDPYRDPAGAGYQMIQSMIAVGSGQLWGKGLGYGSQSHLNFLPEAETDFIFAAFAEEWGFAGTLAALSLFGVVLWRIVAIGQRAGDNFSRLYAVGFAALVFVQTFIHVGMNMGVMPITGLTLPFVSYGGSSLISLLIGVGMLQNIKVNARRSVRE